MSRVRTVLGANRITLLSLSSSQATFDREAATKKGPPVPEAKQEPNVVVGIPESGGQSCYDGEHPSVGSAKHAMNMCKPCHYFLSKKGCQAGKSCSFCHYKHGRRSTRDLPKALRELCLRHVTMIHQGRQGSDERALAERELLAWLAEESRLGAYAFKALSSYQGPSSCRAEVLELMEKPTAFRQGRVNAEGNESQEQAEPADFGEHFKPDAQCSTGDPLRHQSTGATGSCVSLKAGVEIKSVVDESEVSAVFCSASQ